MRERAQKIIWSVTPSERCQQFYEVFSSATRKHSTKGGLVDACKGATSSPRWTVHIRHRCFGLHPTNSELEEQKLALNAYHKRITAIEVSIAIQEDAKGDDRRRWPLLYALISGGENAKRAFTLHVRHVFPVCNPR